MKNILTFLIVILISLTSKAQDIIITQKGDSIHCKVSQITNNNTYFTINQTISHLPSSEVSSIIFSSFETSKKKSNTKAKNALNEMKIVLKYGIGKRTAELHPSITNNFTDYYTDLNSGVVKGFNAEIFLNRTYAIGFQYSIFTSYNRMDGVSVFDEVNQEYLYGNLIDDISIEFYGPSIVSRYYFFNNKFQLTSLFSVGKTEYRNKAVVINRYNMTGFTIGFATDLNLEYKIAKHISLGCGLLI